jgi:hypothetical protein
MTVIRSKEIVERTVKSFVHHRRTAHPHSAEPFSSGDGALNVKAKSSLRNICNVYISKVKDFGGNFRLSGLRLLLHHFDVGVLQKVFNEVFIPSSQFLAFRTVTRNASFQDKIRKAIPQVEILDGFTDV